MKMQPEQKTQLESTPESTEIVGRKVIVACVAGALVPGLGHAILSKWDRAIVFFCTTACMFSLGLYLQGELFGPDFDTLYSSLKFVADAGSGLFYWISWLSELGAGDSNAYTYDYANVFLYVAGLLNMLVVVDVFDIAMGRKR